MLLHKRGDQFQSLKDPSTKWTLISWRLKLEVDVKAQGVFSAQLQLQKGPWIAALLQGAASSSLVTGICVTLKAHEG